MLSGFKEEPTLGKTIGIIACTVVTAATLWVINTNSSVPTMSADEVPGATTSQAKPDANRMKANAQKLLARSTKLAKWGQFNAATKLAKQAAAYPVKWQTNEMSPQKLLAQIESAKANYAQSPSNDDILNELLAEDGREFVAPSSVDNKLSPSNTDDLDQFLVPQEESEAKKPVKAQPKQIAKLSPLDEKKFAVGLVKQAQQDLKEGRYELAQEKALKAHQMQVAWKLFELQPQHILDEVERYTGVVTFPRENGFVESTSETANDSLNDDNSFDEFEFPETADDKLVQDARNALKEGNIDDAREKAVAASKSKSGPATGLFADDPELVIQDIDRVKAEQELSETIEPEFAAEDSTKNTRNKQLAQKLLKEARSELKAGHLTAAESKATEAAELKVTYSKWEDNPELVLADISRINARKQTPESEEPQRIAETETLKPLRSETNAPAMSNDTIAVVSPNGVSAKELYMIGLQRLSEGDRDAAYDSFLQAYNTGQQLDPRSNQQLQDFLRALAPRKSKRKRGNRIQQVGFTDRTGSNPATPGSEIDDAERQMAVQYDRLRSETLNSIVRAERLREKNPARSVEILDKMLAEIEESNVEQQTVAPLVSQLSKTRTSIETYRKRMAPILDAAARKKEVKEEVERDIDYKVRIEQEFADLVDEFNRLMEQRQYADAELVAKQARELDGENPSAQVMFFKAQFARRNMRNNEMKDNAEEAWYSAITEVEESKFAHYGDPIQYPKKWSEMSKRRSKYAGVDNHEATEQEIRIEKSLSRQISLHFDERPLQEVVQHIQDVANINVMFDRLALEEEGLTSDMPVTINVEGVMLKSALNLILEQFRLTYTIEDEVLKITNHFRQQGKLEARIYPVADLVVPIPDYNPGWGSGGLSTMDNARMPGAGVAQYNVPAFGGMIRPSGQAFAQVNGNGANDPFNGLAADNTTLQGAGSAEFDSLTNLIVGVIEPESWTEVGGQGHVTQFGNTLSLVIRQTSRVHEEIAALLKQLRRLHDLQVTIEVRFVTVADRFFERIGIDFDFSVQDNIDTDDQGLPAFGTPTIPGQGGLLGAAGQAQAGAAQAGAAQAGANAAAGGIGGGMNARDGILHTLAQQAQAGQAQAGQAQQGQQAQAGQAAQAGAAGGFFSQPPGTNNFNLDDYQNGGSIVGLSAPGQFTNNLDVDFQQGSFNVGVPDFGGFNPDAGIQVGMAILSDLEAFFFIQAAQGDERSNLLFAPKVTLFNGRTANVTSAVNRPFVVSLIPTVGFFSVGFTPVIQDVFDGVSMTVRAVISADRRYVRLTVAPIFQNLTDVFTFSFLNTGGGAAQGQGGGAQAGGAGFGGGQAGNQGVGGGANAAAGGIGGGLNAREGLLLSLQQQAQAGQAQQGAAQAGGQQGNVGNNQANAAGFGTVTIQQPVVEQVTVTTTVSVPDGGTVLLGGVKRLREGRNMAGVPILNKIPYVSRLFSNTGVGRETESLMLMVTPRIIIQEEEEELLDGP